MVLIHFRVIWQSRFVRLEDATQRLTVLTEPTVLIHSHGNRQRFFVLVVGLMRLQTAPTMLTHLATRAIKLSKFVAIKFGGVLMEVLLTPFR